MTVTLGFHYLPADVLGLEDWSREVLARRPRPAVLAGMVVPDDLDAFPTPARSFEPEQRAELARVLEERLASFEPHVAVLESARRLRHPGAALVLAGQQPALLGGPLYNLYKALHVVVLARALESRWGTPVVPGFWNHSDDHDVAEVHHLWIQNPNCDLRKVSLAGLSSGRTPLARIRFSEDRHHLGALAGLLRQNLWEGPEQTGALELFLPREGETFSGAFTRVLLGLCGHLGLVVIEPDWIRAPASHALASLVALDLAAELAAGAEAVRGAHREPPIEPGEAALLFRLSDERRLALRLSGEGFRYDGEAGSRTGVELAAEIVQDPSAWSAGALLRPVIQDLVLPVAAYVGGWAELAYHSELVPLRRAAGAPLTPFVPRLTATLVDASARESLLKLDLELADVLRARGRIGEAGDAAPSSPTASRLRAVAGRASGELLALREEVAQVDRGLGQQVRRTADQLESLVGKLAEKLDRVQANAAGTGRRHVRRLAGGLFPLDQPQERVRGALEFVARHGRAWVDECLAGIDPLPTEHLVVHL